MTNLTEEETLALPEEFNLADGHAYRPWNEAEEAIIDSIATIFRSVDRRHRQRIEEHYLQTFLRAAGQSFRPEHFTHFMCYTASTALEVLGNFLRVNGLSVALIEPCFDNLHDILARHWLRISMIPEDIMLSQGEALRSRLHDITADAIILVNPNNPSGTFMRRDTFEQIVQFCSATRRILVLDATFRFYLPDEEVYDQYGALADAGIECMVIGDTGKTWPTLEIKAPFFSVSSGMATRIAHIYSDFILHVSPAALELLSRFLALPKRLGIGHVRAVVQENRRVLGEAIRGSCLTAVAAGHMGVEWLAISSGEPAAALKARLSRGHVHVLAGNQFFWSAPARGDRFLRVALSRDTGMFRRAAARIGAISRGEDIG